MKKIVPYITVTNTKNLLSFYKRAFKNITIEDMLLLDDVEGFESYIGKVGHAHIKINGNSVFLTDQTNQNLVVGNNFHFTLELDDESELNQAFSVLSEEGKIYHPIKEMFWCDKTFYLKDKFGIAWSMFIGLK